MPQFSNDTASELGLSTIAALEGRDTGSYKGDASENPVSDGSIPNRLPDSNTTRSSNAAQLKQTLALFMELRDLERASYQAANYQPVINIKNDTSGGALGKTSSELFTNQVSLPYNAEERLASLAQQLIVERVAEITAELGELGVTVDDELLAFATEEE